ncbi:MAG: aminotransferase class V-fold PLP-dependent enzyme [Planctomycetia bacterium]|nr:aminotransferase class V-fold PLP-dependent enzyme [Planctomycetia bacterium]
MTQGSQQRIYLDNASTSWPKPPEVYDAVDRWQRENGAAAGRGTSAAAMETDRQIELSRRAVAQLLGTPHWKNIVFTLNGTDALHLAIQGLIRPGDHVVATVIEHNSVLRPLRQLGDPRGVAVAHVGCDQEGIVSARSVLDAINSKTKFVVVSHASNVTGTLQPIAEIGAELRKRDIPLLVDAAQTVGEIPLDVDELGCDLLAASGHKGLLGPLGTGILYVRTGMEERLKSIRSGGTGTESSSTLQPTKSPEKYESGNLNVPGIIGLGEGARWLARQRIDSLRKRTVSLMRRLLQGLEAAKGLSIVGPREAEKRVGLVSVAVDGYDPQEVATILAGQYGIEARAGLHCAPLMHRALGTESRGGTLRISLGHFNTAEEVDAVVAALSEIAAAAVA